MNQTESIEVGKILKIDLDNVDGGLLIKKKFKLLSKENLGSLIFSILGIILAGIALLKGNSATLIIGCLLGGISLVVSILSVLKDRFDFILVKNGCISFRYNFIKRKLDISHEDQLIIKSWKEEIKMKHPPFKHLEIRLCRMYFIQNDKTEMPIFSFETNEDNNEKALKFIKYVRTEIFKRSMF